METSTEAKQLYQENAVEGATPVELVILLYDSVIEDMRRALAAMQSGDIESRCAGVGHALMVLQQLQGTLDFERGGSAARQFDQFYNLMRAKLLEAQMRSSREVMQEQIRSMSDVRNCWVEAQRILQPPPTGAAAAQPEGQQGRERTGWNA